MPRWWNVPAPSKNAQIIVIGTCLEMVPDRNLCIDMDSIHLPSTTATAGIANFNTPVKSETVGNWCKFATCAPPCVILTLNNKVNKIPLYGL